MDQPMEVTKSQRLFYRIWNKSLFKRTNQSKKKSKTNTKLSMKKVNWVCGKCSENMPVTAKVLIMSFLLMEGINFPPYIHWISWTRKFWLKKTSLIWLHLQF